MALFSFRRAGRSRAVAAYREDDQSEEQAKRNAYLDMVGRVVESGIGGALSGGLMGGGNALYNYVKSGGSSSTGHSTATVRAYEGRNLAEDGDLYSYDFLTKLPDMEVTKLPEVEAVRTADGKVDARKAVDLGIKNAQAVGTERDGKLLVPNRYTGKPLLITSDSIRHGLNGSLNRLLTNARLGAVIGEVVKNAVPINALTNKAKGVTGTYAMAGYATDSAGREFVAIVTVEQRSGKVDGLEVYDVTHAVSGRQKNGSQASTKLQGVYPIKATTVSIADILRVVNSTHQSVLSEDVLARLGETRDPKGQYTGQVKFALKEGDGESLEGLPELDRQPDPYFTQLMEVAEQAYTLQQIAAAQDYQTTTMAVPQQLSQYQPYLEALAWDMYYGQQGDRAQRNVRATNPLAGRYSIQETADGKKYVRADRQVIFGNDPNSWSEQLERYINGKIRKGEDVHLIGADGDELTLTAVTAGKVSSPYRSDGTRLSNAEYERKVNAGVHLDELVQVSRDQGRIAPDKEGRHGDFAKGGWKYRTAYFQDFDGTYYRINLSAAVNADGTTVYNIGSIEERSFPTIAGSSAESGALSGGKTSSTDRVLPREEKVNGKFSAVELTASQTAGYASAEGTDAGLVADGYVQANMDGGMFRQLNAMCQALGVRARFVDSVLDGQGNAQINGNEILIAKDCQDPIRFVLGHELTHRVQQLAPEAYQAFRDIAAQDETVRSDVERKQRLYADRGIELDYEGALDEATADYAGRLMEDGRLMDEFIERHRTDRTLLEKLRDVIRALIGKLTGKERTQAQTAEARLTAALEAAAKQAEMEVGTNAARTEGGEVRYELKGLREDGIEVYETSKEVQALPYKRRIERFLDIMGTQYVGRTARFNVGGDTYYAKFDRDDLRKNIYGDKRSSQRGWKAKINVGADGDIFDLVENATYHGSSAEKGKTTRAHKDVAGWEYFIKTVQIDGWVFDVLANVRKKPDGEYVYSIQIRENRRKAPAPPRQYQHGTAQSDIKPLG